MAKVTLLLFSLFVAIATSNYASAESGVEGLINLGGVNLNSYCQKRYGSGFKSVLVGKTAGDWTCQKSQNERRPISVENACKMQYGNRALKAKAVNWNNPLSWYCFGSRKTKG